MDLKLFIIVYPTHFWVNSGILNFETCNISLFQITVSFWWLSNVVMQAKSTLWLDYYSSECGAQECLIVHNRLHCLFSTASCCCCPLFLFGGAFEIVWQVKIIGFIWERTKRVLLLLWEWKCTLSTQREKSKRWGGKKEYTFWAFGRSRSSICG